MRNKISLKSQNKQVKRIRKLTWELYAQYQIPSRLCFAICNADNMHDETDVKFFTEVTRELMRVRGFYRDQSKNSQMNEEFTRLFDEYKKRRKGV